MAKQNTTKRSQEDWKQLIENQATSGLSIKDYCHHNQITLSNYYARKARLNKDANKRTDDWLPVKLPAKSTQSISANQSWNIELALPSGVTLKMRSS